MIIVRHSSSSTKQQRRPLPLLGYYAECVHMYCTSLLGYEEGLSSTGPPHMGRLQASSGFLSLSPLNSTVYQYAPGLMTAAGCKYSGSMYKSLGHIPYMVLCNCMSRSVYFTSLESYTKYLLECGHPFWI